MHVILDGNQISDRESLHDFLMLHLHFPAYYGRNLDALYDLLTEIPEDTHIEILNADILQDKLGTYSGALINALNQASENNPHFSIKICSSAVTESIFPEGT